MLGVSAHDGLLLEAPSRQHLRRTPPPDPLRGTRPPSLRTSHSNRIMNLPVRSDGSEECTTQQSVRCKN